MSSSLYWEVPRPNRNELSDGIKRLLRDRYGDPVDVFLSHGRDYDWLQGLAAAGGETLKKEAKKLCDLIDRYESVRVFESYD